MMQPNGVTFRQAPQDYQPWWSAATSRSGSEKRKLKFYCPQMCTR